MKICNNPKCSSKGSFLPLNEFNKNKNNKDGLSHRCKKCVKESVKKSYNKNREYYIKDSIERQKQFKIYLDELDRRRNTNYAKIYPQIYSLIKNL